MYLSALSLALNRPGAVSLEQVVASLFAAGEQGAWYDPSAANVTWRRNLLTYTEQFDNAAWSKELTTSQANQTTDPFGSSLADTLVDNTNLGRHIIYQTLSGDFGIDRTLSVYAKANTLRYLFLSLTNTGDTNCYSAIFDLQDGVATATKNNGTATVVAQMSAVGNGWYRCSISGVVASTGSGNFFPLIGSSDRAGFTGSLQNNNAPNYSGTSQSLYLYGAQLERGTTATAYQRIVTPEITYLADVQSQPLLFQDSTGATPVTAVEQPVGLILDKRKGLVLGPELITNGDFSSGLTGWSSLTPGTSTVTVSGGAVTFQGGAAEYPEISQAVLTLGQFYKVTFTKITGVDASSMQLRIGPTTQIDLGSLPAGTHSAYGFCAGGTSLVFVKRGTSTNACTIDNISVRLFDGNHAYQTTSAARPVLRARYNLLTYSEQFDTTWLNAGVVVTANNTNAPDGTATAESIVETAGGSNHEVYKAVSVVANTTYSFSCHFKQANNTKVLMFANYLSGTGLVWALIDLTGVASPVTSANVTAVAVPAANGFIRATITAASGAATTCNFGFSLSQTAGTFNYSGVNGNGIYVWGADLRVGTSAGDYQRIAAATDYATTSTITGQPFRPYLNFDAADGTADSLNTASVDFSATDEMLVALALNKLSDATTAIVAELSATSASNNGSWTVLAPSNNGLNSYRFQSKGTSLVEPGFGAFAPAPDKCVLVGQADISADSATIRRNKALVDTSTGDQGTGNYGNYPMYFGRRGGTSNPFTGQMYGVVIRGKTCTAGELAAVETYLAGKAGLTL